MARDLSTLFDNFKPGMGGIGLLLHLRSGSPGERPTGFVAPPPICGWSWKQVPLPSAKGLRMLAVSDCYISLVFCSFQLAILRLHSDFIFRKKTTIPSMIIF